MDQDQSFERDLAALLPLEDLVAAAINDAVHKVEAQISQKMAAVTAGMQLPPGLKLPF